MAKQRDGAAGKQDEVVLYGYPPLVFIYPLILLGFFFYFTESYQWLSPRAEAWIYIGALVVVILTIGVDINRNVTIFWLVLIFGGWFAAMWLRDVKGFMYFDRLIHWAGSLNPQWSRDFGLIVSIILSIFYVLIIVKARLNDRWRFVNNEIEHQVLGSVDSAMGRGAKRITTSYPDSLEFLLLMSGTITVYSAQGRTVLAQIQRVPFLPMRASRISKILETVQVTQADVDSEDASGTGEETSGDTEGLR